MTFIDQIKENNKTHKVEKKELNQLLKEAKKIYSENFDKKVWFERSVFINWTCAIADCRYCYLSTRPKLEKNALRSKESILAEILICKLMGWRVGYITGGLRVESSEQLVDLLREIDIVYGEKIMMNFGPYSNSIIEKFKPQVTGMGSAIESFDEELHNYICPSKPLKSLMLFLENLKEQNMQKLITIILGLGEKKEHIETVIEKIKEYNIEKVQLCFLKPQENTVFDEVPPPDPDYMAWWISKIRIACPKTIIKIALVKERIEDIELYLEAGANCFSRFMVFNDFGTKYAEQLEKGCEKSGRELEGNFISIPEDLNEERIYKEVEKLEFGKEENIEKKKEIIKKKALEYYNKLRKLKERKIEVINL